MSMRDLRPTIHLVPMSILLLWSRIGHTAVAVADHKAAGCRQGLVELAEEVVELVLLRSKSEPLLTKPR